MKYYFMPTRWPCNKDKKESAEKDVENQWPSGITMQSLLYTQSLALCQYWGWTSRVTCIWGKCFPNKLKFQPCQFLIIKYKFTIRISNFTLSYLLKGKENMFTKNLYANNEHSQKTNILNVYQLVSKLNVSYLSI